MAKRVKGGSWFCKCGMPKRRSGNNCLDCQSEYMSKYRKTIKQERLDAKRSWMESESRGECGLGAIISRINRGKLTIPQHQNHESNFAV
jgi:hypothetical protein